MIAPVLERLLLGANAGLGDGDRCAVRRDDAVGAALDVRDVVVDAPVFEVVKLAQGLAHGGLAWRTQAMGAEGVGFVHTAEDVAHGGTASLRHPVDEVGLLAGDDDAAHLVEVGADVVGDGAVRCGQSIERSAVACLSGS